jgi:hypothetical protein
VPALLDCPSLLHPDFQLLPPPVVVTGMHRSGTSLAAALLAAVGVYMGPEWAVRTRRNPALRPDDQLLQNGYAEAEDFRCLNDRLLAGAGAGWSDVEPFLAVREQPRFAQSRAALLRAATFGRLQRSYLDPIRGAEEQPWGWKDPRNSLTLPLWLQLFPEARVVHVRREREAAVESLHRRARTWAASPGPALPWGERAREWAGHPWRTATRAARRWRVLPPAPPDPCLDREYCRRLYDRYLHECMRFRGRSPRYLEVEYEAVLADPVAAARGLAEFAGCSPPRSRLQAAAALVRPRTTPIEHISAPR